MLDNLTQRYLASFSRRANRRLATLARELAGALAGGNHQRADELTEEGLLLSHGLESCDNRYNQLTAAQRLYIAGKLLPLFLDDMVETEISTTLTLNALSPRRRGQTAQQPLVVTGQVGGTVPAGSQLLVTRDGVELQRVPAQAGPYSVTDNTPGTRYRVEITGTSLSQERVRPLTSPVLFGTGPAGSPPAYLVTLPAAPDAVEGKLRLTFTGQRNRILLCVPLSSGTVGTITQPDDNDADIAMAFTRRQVSLDFGADGQQDYEVLENYADFIGAFTADFSLA